MNPRISIPRLIDSNVARVETKRRLISKTGVGDLHVKLNYFFIFSFLTRQCATANAERIKNGLFPSSSLSISSSLSTLNASRVIGSFRSKIMRPPRP